MPSVYVDNDIDQAVPLHCVRLGTPWNGWAVPIVTADQFADWLQRMAQEDREWSESQSWHTSYALHYSDESMSESWPTIGTELVDGTDVELYAIDGWTFYEDLSA